MLKRTAARALVVASLVFPSIAVLSSPALAFTKTSNCFQYDEGDGLKTIFVADNGTYLAEVEWWWNWTGQGNAKYRMVITDLVNDNAGVSVRVDNGSSVIEYISDRDLGYSVRKYRVVWNGYASNWLSPTKCGTP